MAKKKDETVNIRVLQPSEPEPVEQPFTHYLLVALDSKGKETGAEFQISKKGFQQTYINRTAKPDGNANPKNAQFKVKKKIS